MKCAIKCKGLHELDATSGHAALWLSSTRTAWEPKSGYFSVSAFLSSTVRKMSFITVVASLDTVQILIAFSTSGFCEGPPAATR